MSPVRDFLQRFRPAGTPGKAAAAVPADRARDLAAELEPVLSLLAGADAERTRVLSEASSDAARIRQDARTRADGMVAAAMQRAEAVRADAAAAVLASAEADASAALRAVERDVQVIRERAAQKMPGYVSRAVRAVRMLADPAPADAGDAVRAVDEAQARAATRWAP
jgi:vacuolar-type H+-ATPase subunit H